MTQEFLRQPVFKAVKSAQLRAARLDSEGYPALPVPSSGLPREGEVIQGRYRIERMLGQGQFGWVFLVCHVWLGQRFAMKVMHPRVAHDPQWVERFRQEARQTSALGHEHIVFVTDFDHCERFGYFFVMEYLEGVTLSQLIKRPDGALMAPERAFDIIFQACDALSAMHEVGVVHRDLKPSNIMISEREGADFIKLLDFGISSTVFEVSESKKLYGTPAYMAPEQTRTMQVDGRADQFALATILYQLLVGERPWPIKGWADASRKAREGQRVQPVSARRSHAMITPELDAVLERALSLDPEGRWEDIDAFAHALYTASGLGEAESSPTQLKLLRRTGEHDVAELGAQPSMVTLISQERSTAPLSPSARSSQEQTLVSVDFRSNGRLLRAWREGLAQGVFEIGTTRRLDEGDRIGVRLVLEEEQLVLLLEGRVIEVRAGEEGRSHVSIKLFSSSLQKVSQLVATIDAEHHEGGLSPRAVVQAARSMSMQDRLTTGEAFLLSRLSEPTTVQQLRALFSGLSFDLDTLLHGLMQKGLLMVERPKQSSGGWVAANQDAGDVSSESSGSFFSSELDEDPMTTSPFDLLSTRRPSPVTPRKDRSTGGHFLYDQEQIEHVLELVNFFKRTRNYASAIQTLRRALDASPTVGEFYHQLALLHARHHHDTERAMGSIECALQLSPNDPEFLRTREYIRTLARSIHARSERLPS